MQNEGRIILRIEDLFCCRLFLRILRQNVRNPNLICEDFEDGVGWYDPPLITNGSPFLGLGTLTNWYVLSFFIFKKGVSCIP